MVYTSSIAPLILLSGFMGSGKSSYLSRLFASANVATRESGLFEQLEADQRYWGMEMDQYLVAHSAFDSIAQWVNEKGWDDFRAAELKLLKKLLNRSVTQGPTIVSLGGGALRSETMDLIKADQHTFLVWFNISFDVCYDRISNDSARPLVAKGVPFLSELYHQRLPYYRMCDVEFGQTSIDQDWSLNEFVKLCLNVDRK